MPRRLISTGSPFETAFGYSRAVVQEPFVFVAGTTGYDYATMTLPEGAAEASPQLLAHHRGGARRRGARDLLRHRRG